MFSQINLILGINMMLFVFKQHMEITPHATTAYCRVVKKALYYSDYYVLYRVPASTSHEAVVSGQNDRSCLRELTTGVQGGDGWVTTNRRV